MRLLALCLAGLLHLVAGVTAVGSSWWANAADADCISIVTLSQPAVPPDWSACPTVHLAGCPIIPTSTYDVAVVDGGQVSNSVSVQTQAKPGVKWWGDCVGAFNGTEWSAPQGVVNIDDAVACIKSWQFPGQPAAPHVSRVDVHPNLPGEQINKLVGFNDVFQIVQGFRGEEYPGAPIALCP